MAESTITTLTVCCVCKRVAGGLTPESPWMPMGAYLSVRRLRQTDVRLSHTYCPSCYDMQAKAWSLPPHSPHAA